MVNGAFGVLVRRGLIAGAGTLIFVAAAGCGAGGHAASSGTTKAATASPRQTTASPSPSPSETLDGNTLYTLLMSASAMPAGFRIDSSGTRNAGQSLPQDTSQPVSASQACNLLVGTGWILVSGVVTSDFAENDYINASKTAEVSQEIDLFQAGDATKVMSRLWQVFGRCRSFSDQQNGSTEAISQTRARVAGVGDGAIKAVQTSPDFNGGNTLVAVRVGNAIVTCWESSPGSDDGVGALALAERIAKRVSAAQQAG
jgi:hypothetical protein